jgi:hypothetical protein
MLFKTEGVLPTGTFSSNVTLVPTELEEDWEGFSGEFLR